MEHKLMSEALPEMLRFDEFAHLTPGLRRRTLERLSARGEAPAFIRLSPRAAARWRADRILAWIEAKLASVTAPEGMQMTPASADLDCIATKLSETEFTAITGAENRPVTDQAAGLPPEACAGDPSRRLGGVLS